MFCSTLFNLDHPYILPAKEIYTLSEGINFEIIFEADTNQKRYKSSNLIWEWLRVVGNDTEKFANSTDKVNIDVKGRIRIADASREDAGVYQVVIKNGNGVDNYIFEIKIRGLYFFIMNVN